MARTQFFSTPMRPLVAALAVLSLGLSLGACSGTGIDGLGGGTAQPAKPAGPPVAMAGRWLLASPGRGECRVNFTAAPGATEGATAPEGGCPGKFFTTRKWGFEQGSLVLRDHNGQPLAQLSQQSGQFAGKATGGEPVTLTR